MNELPQKLILALYATFVLAALVIVVDFTLPGKIETDEIIKVKRERQQHHNASGNYHYSYTVITSQRQFSVGEDFAEMVQDNEKIEFSVSQIFQEVNWYRLLSSENRSSFSFRIMTGLVLPLLSIVSILLAYRFKKNIGILVFILQLLLIVDLIYLLN